MKVSLFVCVLLVDWTLGSRVILVENAKTCYRRVLAGRRALRSHVRRVLPCERLEDCQRECSEEIRFHCESFNYRLDPTFWGKGLCELMSKPIEHFDLRRDFVDDRNYDFYELDRNSVQPECRPTWHGPSYPHSGFLGSDWKPGHTGSQRPGSSYGSSGSWKPESDYVHSGLTPGSHYAGSKPGQYSNDFWRPESDYGGAWRPGISGNDLRPDGEYGDTGEIGYRRQYNRHYRKHNRNDFENYIPYQIGIGRSDDDWQYGGAQYYNDKNDFKNSLDYWGIDPIPDHHGIRPYGAENEFNYDTLGNRRYNANSWDYSYRYGKRPEAWTPSFGGVEHTGLIQGESSYYGHNSLQGGPSLVEDHGPSFDYDCSSRRRSGMSMGSGAIRRSLLADTVLDCESACFRETAFRCVSYSYRYSKSQGSENCFLSETPYRGLDLASDVSSDVYSIEDHKQCGASTKPWIESECFLHVRSGKAIPSEAASAVLSVKGLGACEAECIRARDFFCRGFSFRYDPPTIGEDIENCILSSTPPSAMHQLRTAPGHELYARGNYGRGCEPDLSEEPASGSIDTKCYLQYDNAARLLSSAARGRARVRDEAACARACTDAPFRCLSFSYSSSPLSEDNCLLSEIRLFDLKLGLDYEHSSNDWLFAFDLFNKGCWHKVIHGHDIDSSHVQELPRPIATIPEEILPIGPPRHPGHHTAPSAPGPDIGSGHPSGPGIHEYPTGSGYPVGPEHTYPGSSGFRPSVYLPGTSGGSGYKPGYLPEPPPPSGSSGFHGTSGFYGPSGSSGLPGHHRPSYPPGDKGIDDFDDQYPIEWRHYTVSGFPCRRGTACARNHITGHWSCEPEGGDIGSWDYCCAPKQRCGYSEGFHKPWCYVGQSKDQWRPCSEKYYPYHQHSIPHPSHGHREDYPKPPRPVHLPSGYVKPWDHHDKPSVYPSLSRRPSGPDTYLPYEDDRRRRPEFTPSPYIPEADRKYWDELYKNGPQAFYDGHGNPLPGYTRVPPDVPDHHSFVAPQDAIHFWPPLAVEDEEFLDPPIPGGFGIARYWPVAYLHKGPPPNTTYFNYQDKHASPSTERYNVQEHMPMQPPNRTPPRDFNSGKTTELPITKNNKIDQPRSREGDEKATNIPATEDNNKISTNATEISTLKNEVDTKDMKDKVTEMVKDLDKKQGIDDKLDDFSSNIEVLNIDDASPKGEKIAETKSLEAEERQIEEIGRLLATRRGGKFALEKRSQTDLESHKIKISRDSDSEELNFGYKFVPVSSKIERRGIVQKVTKDYVDSLVGNVPKPHDGLEVSETNYARAHQNAEVRKAYVNGKVFYDATINDDATKSIDAVIPKPNDALAMKSKEREPKFIKVPIEEPKTVQDNTTQMFGQRMNKSRTISPIRKGRRLHRRRYNPEEVRKRLLEKEKSKEIQQNG